MRLGRAQRAGAALSSGCSVALPKGSECNRFAIIGWLGKIVAFVTFVCFAVEKESQVRLRLGRANRKTISQGHFYSLLYKGIRLANTLSVWTESSWFSNISIQDIWRFTAAAQMFTATKVQVATYLLGVCPFSIAFLVFLNSSVSFVITDLIGTENGVGDAVGNLGFVDELLALVACPFWGILSDRVGVKTVSWVPSPCS